VARLSSPRARRFAYAVSLEADGTCLAEGGDPLRPGEAWTPEHLLLAALVRCTLKSLAFHASRAGIEVESATAAAEGTVTRREEDGRYALVEARPRLEVVLEPTPGNETDLRELLALAERDCFVGASLAIRPRYVWRVNGRDVAVPPAASASA
jgi:organic hydroperoxide reductase OsmC/OhrA